MYTYRISVCVYASFLCASAVCAQPSASAAVTSSSESKGAIREREILAQFPAPGQMIDIGGRKLHLLCQGKGNGPAVIIEGGALASSLSYFTAQDQIQPAARVCTYDRAGLGWSDPAAGSRSLEARADDLHALLGKSGLKAPYILAGHSAGGMMVQVYARKYPQDIAGIILIESSEEMFNTTPESLARIKNTATQLGFAATMADTGQAIPALRVPNGPPEQEVMQRVSAIKAGQDDFVAMSNLPTELQKLNGLSTLGATPLVVIRRGKSDPGFTEAQSLEWIKAQERLAALSTQSILLVAEKSGHAVNLDQPELYLIAVKRIQKMLASPARKAP